MEFEIDDVFETDNGLLWRVSAVVHDSETVYAIDDDGDEMEFAFAEVRKQWKAV